MTRPRPRTGSVRAPPAPSSPGRSRSRVRCRGRDRRPADVPTCSRAFRSTGTSSSRSFHSDTTRSRCNRIGSQSGLPEPNNVHGGHGVRRRKGREDRGVRAPQPLDPVNAKAGADGRERVLAHPAGSHRVAVGGQCPERVPADRLVVRRARSTPQAGPPVRETAPSSRPGPQPTPTPSDDLRDPRKPGIASSVGPGIRAFKPFRVALGERTGSHRDMTTGTPAPSALHTAVSESL